MRMRLRHACTRAAMARIFSPVATELPPYFCTTIGPRDMVILKVESEKWKVKEVEVYFLLFTFTFHLLRGSPALHEGVEFAQGAAELNRHFHPRESSPRRSCSRYR